MSDDEEGVDNAYVDYSEAYREFTSRTLIAAPVISLLLVQVVLLSKLVSNGALELSVAERIVDGIVYLSPLVVAYLAWPFFWFGVSYRDRRAGKAALALATITVALSAWGVL